jgi:predicted neutral ceramidase superfamily lipid hydrolase
LEKGFLEKIIVECKDPQIKIENITEKQTQTIESLVNSVTSEVGRAIVGLAILQLTVKAILPGQSIRLHKGGSGT